jgi:Uma2 family endonuclease
MNRMKVVMLDVPQELLAERHRKGLDVRYEIWEGVLHMVPAPGDAHQELAGEVHHVLLPLAKALGLLIRYEANLDRPGTRGHDDRVPDIVIFKPEHRTERGPEGAEVVIEFRSPGDETYEKLGFYAELGVKEVFVIEPVTRTIELFIGRGKKPIAATPDAQGAFRSVVLGIALSTAPGPKLRLVGKDTDVTIP